MICLSVQTVKCGSPCTHFPFQGMSRFRAQATGKGAKLPEPYAIVCSARCGFVVVQNERPLKLSAFA